MKIIKLLKTIPSNSHNAPYSQELGEHWPKGYEFELFPRDRQTQLRKFYRVPLDSVIIRQIGGEETLVSIPAEQFPALFGFEVKPCLKMKK